MRPALSTAIKVGAPLVAVATLMLGLRVGAKTAVRAAVVFGAPAGRVAPGEKTRLAWQVVTFLDDRGVRETIPIKALTVIGRAKGEESRWTGEANIDGVAEPVLAFTGLVEGDPIELEIRAEGEPEPLAAGAATWQRVAWGREEAERDALGGAARPTSRTGEIGVDVVIESGRLVPGFPSTAWVRVQPPANLSMAGMPIVITPEPGLRVDAQAVKTCDLGWAEVQTVPEAHVVGATFEVREGGVTGKWFGALPVAAGAFFVSAPRTLPEGKASEAVLIAPNPRNVVYAELDDEKGRVTAGALTVSVEPGDPTPRARFALPPLAAGLHWLVVSGEPRGAEHLAGATVAKPILVGRAAGVDPDKPCSVGPWLAQHPASGFGRWVALDGLPQRSAANRGRHRLGLAISLVALLAAALLETILLVTGARGAREALQEQMAALEGGEDASKVTAPPPGGGLAVALLVAVLGFALLAALIVTKG